MFVQTLQTLQTPTPDEPLHAHLVAALDGDACAGRQLPPPESGKVEAESAAPRDGEKPEKEGAAAAEPPPAVFPKPLMQHDAQITGDAPVNLAALQPMPRLSGAFSFMCTLRMDGIDSWTRIFDFSLYADEDSITAGAVELTQDLHFTIFRGKKPISVRVPGFFQLGLECTLLCTVSDSGHMKVYKDGLVVGENPHGLAPIKQDRPHMIVGGHFTHRAQAFRGCLKGVKVWDQEVSWPQQTETTGCDEQAEASQ